MYKIEVNKVDIQKGICADPTFCAVARAFERAGFEFTFLGDGIDGKYIEGTDPQGQRYGRYLPVKVQKWIMKFDADKKSVKPFSFNIR